MKMIIKLGQYLLTFQKRLDITMYKKKLTA